MPRQRDKERDEIIYKLYHGIPIEKKIKSYKRLGAIFNLTHIAIRDAVIRVKEDKNKKG